MKMLIFVVLTFFASSLAIQFREEDDVIVLTKDDFDLAITEHKNLMVEFCEFIFSNFQPSPLKTLLNHDPVIVL